MSVYVPVPGAGRLLLPRLGLVGPWGRPACVRVRRCGRPGSRRVVPRQGTDCWPVYDSCAVPAHVFAVKTSHCVECLAQAQALKARLCAHQPRAQLLVSPHVSCVCIKLYS